MILITMRSAGRWWSESRHAFYRHMGPSGLTAREPVRAMRDSSNTSTAPQGFKSDAERFAGALFTMSVEGFVPATGRGIQVPLLKCL